MTESRFSLVDVAVADDVRQESTGKLLIIGMYLGSIIATSVPILLPTLAFITKWSSPDGSLPAGTYGIVGPDGSVVGRTSAAPVAAGPPVPWIIAVNKFTPVRLEKIGIYHWTFTPKGGRARTLTKFTVGLLEAAPDGSPDRIVLAPD